MDLTVIQQRDLMRGEAEKAMAAVKDAQRAYDALLPQYNEAKRVLVALRFDGQPDVASEAQRSELEERITQLEAERTATNARLAELYKQRTGRKAAKRSVNNAPKAEYTRLLRAITEAKTRLQETAVRAQRTWAQGRILETATEPLVEPLALWETEAVAAPVLPPMTRPEEPSPLTADYTQE